MTRCPSPLGGGIARFVFLLFTSSIPTNEALLPHFAHMGQLRHGREQLPQGLALRRRLRDDVFLPEEAQALDGHGAGHGVAGVC
jgi:hypothetical protein